MARATTWSLRLAALLCMAACAAAAAAAVDFDAELARADELRTSDRAEFDRIVAKLGAAEDAATALQRDRLELMRAYGMVLSGDLAGATRTLGPMLDGEGDAALQFRAGALLANAYALTREFSEGLAVLERILPTADEVGDDQARHQGFLAAAVLYNQVGQFQLGQDYAEKVLADDAAPRSLCFAGNLRLEALQNMGRAEGDEVYEAAIRRCREQNEAIATNLVRSYLARKWHDEGRTDEALALLESYLDEARSTGYPHLVAEFHALIAEFRMARGEGAVAEGHAQSVVALREQLSHSLPVATAYRVLYTLAEERGDAAGALALHKRFAEADKAYLNEVKARELAYQMVRQETMQQTQQIELLNRQNEVLQLQRQVQEKSTQNARLLVLLLLLLLASIGFWAYKTKRVQMSLRRMAETDALTGICNRHHFTQRAVQALSQCARSGEDAALVMFDLDHFKSINDRYGHGTGDWVLRRVVEACLPLCREIDCFGRIGGEEFAILLSRCDARTARRVAEDCRMRLTGIDTAESGHAFRITASFGVTTTALSGHDLMKLMSHADRMLYSAKREGRNRVFVYELPAATPLPRADAAVPPGADAAGDGHRAVAS